MLGFDFQAISVNVHNAHALAGSGRAATGGPLAVADTNPSSVCVD